MSMRTSTHNFLNSVSGPSAIFSHIFRWFHQNNCLAVFFLFLWWNWIVFICPIKKAALTRINIWIYIFGDFYADIYISIDTMLWSLCEASSFFVVVVFCFVLLIFHLFLRVLDLTWIYLNLQKLDNESSPNFASNTRQTWN